MTTGGDHPLRPATFDAFVGQREVVQRLNIYVRAALEREEPLDHVLFAGPPGLGKTTLATLIAASMRGNLVMASGPAIERPADLVGTLTRLASGDVLFIDEIHRLPAACEEYLYTAMEDRRIDITTDTGSTSIDLEPFTLIGATTREGGLSKPFVARFGIRERLEPYEPAELAVIIMASARKLALDMGEDAALEIAKRCRGTPRIANRELKRLRDFVQVQKIKAVDADVARGVMDVLGIDALGLNALDRRILEALDKAGNRPVGLSLLAIAVNEDARTLAQHHEPYLIELGLVGRTPQGRVLTPAGRNAARGTP